MPRITGSQVVQFIGCPLVQRTEISKFSENEFRSAAEIELRATNLPNLPNK